MALIFSTALVAHGEIIAPTNRMNWEPGVTVGVTGGIPQRTGTVIDVTQSPYFADNTGATPTTPIPAQLRYLGISSENQPSTTHRVQTMRTQVLRVTGE